MLMVAFDSKMFKKNKQQKKIIRTHTHKKHPTHKKPKNKPKHQNAKSPSKIKAQGNRGAGFAPINNKKKNLKH